MRIAQRLRRKAEVKILDLATRIGAYAETCASVHGVALSDEEVGFQSLDAIINDLDHCLYTIRLLDRDVFEASNPQAYKKLEKQHPEGGVVSAFRSLRDAATHHEVIIDPHLVRALGPSHHGAYIVFERWRDRAELPKDTFENVDRKFMTERAEAYDEHVAGRYVLDTLFDAFHFFDVCDPKLVARDQEGQIAGFPIPPLELVAGYYRIHPDWPTHEIAQASLRERAQAQLPHGHVREIVGSIADQTILVGWTLLEDSRWAFTEPVDQVMKDVRQGYPYAIQIDGATRPVALDERGLVVDSCALMDEVEDVPDGDQPWSTWATLAMEDATIYRRQRKA